MTLQRPITQYADSDGLKIAYSYCRACRADYKQAHYAANKRRYITNAARRRGRLIEENVRRILQFFESHPCVDCGEGDALVLEFDHVGDKSFSIGSNSRPAMGGDRARDGRMRGGLRELSPETDSTPRRLGSFHSSRSGAE